MESTCLVPDPEWLHSEWLLKNLQQQIIIIQSLKSFTHNHRFILGLTFSFFSVHWSRAIDWSLISSAESPESLDGYVVGVCIEQILQVVFVKH